MRKGIKDVAMVLPLKPGGSVVVTVKKKHKNIL